MSERKHHTALMIHRVCNRPLSLTNVAFVFGNKRAGKDFGEYYCRGLKGQGHALERMTRSSNPGISVFRRVNELSWGAQRTHTHCPQHEP